MGSGEGGRCVLLLLWLSPLTCRVDYGHDTTVPCEGETLEVGATTRAITNEFFHLTTFVSTSSNNVVNANCSKRMKKPVHDSTILDFISIPIRRGSHPGCSAWPLPGSTRKRIRQLLHNPNAQTYDIPRPTLSSNAHPFPNHILPASSE